LYEEHGDVVPDNIPVAFLGVELHGKSSNISNGICTASATKDGGETNEDGCSPGRIGQDAGLGNILCTLKELERPESSNATGMDNPFRDTLMIEAMNLMNQ